MLHYKNASRQKNFAEEKFPIRAFKDNISTYL